MKHTFIELLRDINANLEKKEQWEKSKLRYYLREVLKEPPQKRGKESTYPELTLHKLLFISKLMGSNLSPSIRQLKEILAGVSNDEITRVALGTERLEVGMAGVDASGEISHRTLSGEAWSETDPSMGRVMQTSLRMEDVGDSATDYVTREFSKHLSARTPSPRAPKTAWQKMNFGPDLQIRYRKSLTESQKKQLRLAGELIRIFVSQED